MTVPSIDLSAPVPRVNFQLMSKYEGKRVRLVGKVEEISGTTMKVKTSDDAMVDVLLTGAAPTDAFVEIDGTVEGPNVIREESNVGFGNDFDMKNYNQVCTLMNDKYRSLFL
ncbi:Replication protein A 14 kDa subunit B [Picochlorum sp. SENEW3]|nr:Replication protein A 14 kDa subunit B [Picochlorum sp. SENEW3]